MRHGISLIIGLALVVAGCGSLDLSQAETTTTSTTVAAPSTTVTTAPGGPGDGIDSGGTLDPTDTAWFRQEWSTPDGVDPYDAVWGDPGIVVLGYQVVEPDDSPTPNGLWFSDGETWTATTLADVTMPDEYGFTPVVTDLAWFGGRYLAFLMGDPTTTPGRASMLTSDDGVNWDLEYLGSTPTAALPAGLYATPESPPWPGTSAITKASMYTNEITVVGWTVLGSGESFLSVPVVWRSTDGRSWSTKALPNANFDNEWASNVAVGPLGYLVEVAGPVHQSAYLWYSPDGNSWTYVGDQFDDQWRMLVSIAAGEESFIAALMDLEDDGGQALHLWRSLDGLEWEQIETPFPLESSSDGWANVDLVNTGTGIVGVVTGDFQSDLWRSTDARLWARLPSILHPSTDPLDGVARIRPFPILTDGRLSLIATMPGRLVRWTEAAETRSVILVAQDDVLNTRSGPGVAYEVVATLAPTATGVVLTGRKSPVGSSVWVEIVTDEGSGWVNDYYLAEPDSVANPFSETVGMDLVDELAAVFAGRGDLTELASQRGIFVAHHDRARPFIDLDEVLTDSTMYAWAGTGCSPEECPDETPQLTFAAAVADSFLSAWIDEDRRVRVDEVIPGGNGMVDDFIVPAEFINLHFVAVHDPGDNPEYGGIDWFTWYVYFTYEAGVPVVLGMSIDEWAP